MRYFYPILKTNSDLFHLLKKNVFFYVAKGGMELINVAFR